MTKNYPTVSVVIPIYNNEQYVKDCLDALGQQTVKPFEIIVIDNNCTDNSIAIAKSYTEVIILKEPTQGLSYARNKGLSAAKGDLLLRIDTDTVLPKNYIETLQNIAIYNPDVAGFTGYGISRYEFIPYISLPWSWMYFMYTRAVFGYTVLWGANMSIRREYWPRIKHIVSNDSSIHEDQDLSLALASVGGRSKVFSKLTTSVQMEAVLHFSQFHKYMTMMKNLKSNSYPKNNKSHAYPKLATPKRLLLWALSAPTIYVFYAITLVYSLQFAIKKYFIARLFLADRPQDS